MAKKMSRARIRTALASSLILALAATGIAFAALTEDAPERPESQSVEVTSEPGDLTLVCPPALQLPTDEDTDPEFDPAPDEASTWLQAQLIEGPGHVALSTDEDPDGESRWGQAWNPTGTVSAAFNREATDTSSAQRAGGGSVVAAVPSGDLAGIAAGVCESPSFDRWLVGLSTMLETSTRLVVHNPGDSSLTVTIHAWSATGPLVEDDSVRIQVPPRSSQFTLVEGLFPDERRLALRLTSSGGPFHATVQQNQLDGLEPAGMDYVTTGASPASEFALAGIRVDETELGSDTASRIQLLNPHEDELTVDFTLLGTDGPVDVPGWDSAVTLAPGTVAEVSMAGVPAGDYAVIGEADGEIIASAIVVRNGDPEESEDPRDTAWIPSMPIHEAGTQSVISIPDGLEGYVALAPTTDIGQVQATIKLWARDGTVIRELHVRDGLAGQVNLLSLDELTPGAEDPVGAISVESVTPVQWAVGIEGVDWAETGAHAFAVLTPTVLAEPGQTVTVRHIS